MSLEVAQFIANLNTGIVYLVLSDASNAITFLRQSYGCAIFMEDIDAQSVSDFVV